MKKTLFLVLVFLSTAAFMATAKDLPGVCQEFAPFNYLDANKKLTGGTYELLVEVFKRMGYDLKAELLPWNRAYQTAATGEAAILFTTSSSAEREKDLYFSDGVIFLEVVFFKRKADKITWNKLEDVKDYSISYIDGYNYGETMMTALKNNTFNKVEATPGSATADYTLFMKLLNKRIDLAVCPKPQGLYIFKMNAPQFDGLDFIDKSIGPKRDFYVGFSKKWPGGEALKDQFNLELKKAIADGTRDKIYDKFGIAH